LTVNHLATARRLRFPSTWLNVSLAPLVDAVNKALVNLHLPATLTQISRAPSGLPIFHQNMESCSHVHRGEYKKYKKKKKKKKKNLYKNKTLK